MYMQFKIKIRRTAWCPYAISIITIRYLLKSWNTVLFDAWYYNVIMSPMASQITFLAIAYSSVYSGADQTKY